MSDAAGKHIGRRLKAARLQRGKSLRLLADMAGLSPSFLSMVENGQRKLERTSDITALANALRIAPTELTGQPLVAADVAGAAHEAIPALRLTLMGMHLNQPPDQPVPDGAGEDLAARVTTANRLYHSCEYEDLARRLPRLLADLHAAVDAAPSHERSGLLRLLADAYHPACTLLLKYLGYTDLAFIAVTRAAEAITELDDPLYSALSGFFHTHVLMSAGSPVQALASAEKAAGLAERNLTGAAAHALLGELHLIRATCLSQDSSRSGADRTSEVRAHLKEAGRLAKQTGETKVWHLNFGPTNVGIHQVSLNTDLGRYGAAAAARAGVRPETLGAPGRAAAFHADLGRSLAHLRARDAEAVAELLRAEHLAPQRIHANPLVRQAVFDLLDRPLAAHVNRDLLGLAHRMGLPL